MDTPNEESRVTDSRSAKVSQRPGFGPGSLRKFGLPAGLETCTNVIPILAMFDFAAAFPSVAQSLILHILQHMGLPREAQRLNFLTVGWKSFGVHDFPLQVTELETSQCKN